MKRTLLLAVLSSFIVQFAIAQQVKQKALSAKKAIAVADALYAQTYYYNAAEFYLEAIKEEDNNRYALYGAAMAYFKARDYQESEAYFRRFFRVRGKNEKQSSRIKKENERDFPLVKYHYGVTLKRNANYDEAKAVLNDFLENYKGGSEESNLRREVLVDVAGCEIADSLMKNIDKAKVWPLNSAVNKPYSESSPVPIGDSVLIFASLDAEDLIYLEKNQDEDYNKTSQFYLTKLQPDGNFSKPKSLSMVINDKDYLVGNGAFNEEYTRFYFNKCKDRGESVICAIYLSTFKSGRWGEPELLPKTVNNPKYTSTQPTVKTDANGRETVYYISDNPEGEGGMDIWYFLRDKRGEIIGPRPLKQINTPMDELTPYFDNKGGALYFSSTGYPGLGGMDIFRAPLSNTLEWGEIENMGAPINSSVDDIYFTTVNNKRGYLVSNRVGTTPLTGPTCCDDLWHYEQFKYVFQGTVLQENADSSKMVEGTKMSLYKIINDTTEILVQVDSVTKDRSKYQLELDPDSEYRMVIDRTGYEKKEELISTKDLGNNKFVSKDFYMKKSEFYAGGMVMGKKADGSTEILDATVRLYELDEATGKETLVKEQKLSEYNPRYGLSLDGDKFYKVNVEKKGYFTRNFNINTYETKDDVVLDDILMEKMVKDKAYRLSNIYYAFGSADLTPRGKAVLDTLFTLLIDNPDIVIELGAHTDAIGSDVANLKLSQRRAESCVKHLLAKGIASVRMKPKGYGESKPIAKNKNADGSDNPKGRQQNRRTEFKIIGGLEDNIQIQYEDKRSN